MKEEIERREGEVGGREELKNRSNATTIRKSPTFEAASYSASTRLTLDVESTWDR